MLQLTPLEFLFRLIPEGFLFIFASYAFSKTVVEKKRYIVSSILFAVMIYLIRMLPIHYGVHTILSLIVCIVLTVTINKIDIMNAVQAVIISMIVGFVSEGINIFLIQLILTIDLNTIFQNPVQKIIFGFPSLMISGCIIGGYYFRLSKRKELKYVSN